MKKNIILRSSSPSACFVTLCCVASLCVAISAQPRPAGKRSAAKHATGHPSRIFPEPAGLALVALGQDGFALAADGAQANKDGTLSETQKIMPVGKQAAVAIAGTVSIQDSVDRPFREELNVVRIASVWLESHPDATFENANKEINAHVADAAKKFFAKRKPGVEAAKEKFALVFAGYADGKPRVIVTRYFMPLAQGAAMKTVTTSSEAKAGELWALGAVKVQQELLSGTATSLQKFKLEPEIKKFRSSKHEELAAQDFVAAFATVLHATESGEGQKFAAAKLTVAPPNKFAIITPANGFAWVSK